MMKTIWLFREKRSGGTAFTTILSSKLNRPIHFIDPNINIKHPLPDTNINIFDTHEFELLKDMSSYDTPVLIRCSRRNKVDQYLSELMVRWLGKTVYKTVKMDDRVFNINSSTPESVKNIFATIEPTIITKRDLTIVHRMYVENQKLWDEYSKLYPSCTIYYEDLCEGIDIPLLELTDCKLSNNLEIKKLPDYKQRVFLNYDMLVKWTQELLDEDFG